MAPLGLFCLYLFREIVIDRHLLTGTDFVTFYLGMKQFLYDEIWQQRNIPFWNPYIFGGMPFWAHFESTIFYPLDFLFWVMPAEAAYGYTMFLHMMLAGFFMYILARSFGMGRAGSFVAAAIFTCNGFIMAILFLGQMCPVQSYIWLPLVIYFLNRALKSDKYCLSASLAGLVWGVQVLAGAPQDAFYTFIASLVFLACHLRPATSGGANIRKAFVVSFLLFLVGAGLSSIQIVPAFELIGESVRSVVDSYEMVTDASYPPQGIITAIMPHFYGNYADNSFWVSNVPFSVPQQNLYVGIVSLFLLLFLSYKDCKNKNLIWFAGLLALISLVLALGKHTPVYKLAYLFPGFDRFRAPSKIIVLWVFALGLLAGKGMDNLLSLRVASISRRTLICVGILISLTLLNLLFYLDRSIILKVFSPFILEEAVPDKLIQAAEIMESEFHRLSLFSGIAILLILLLNRGFLGRTLAAALICLLLLVDLAYVNGGGVQHDDQTYGYMKGLKREVNITLGKDKDMYRVGSFAFRLGPNLEMYLGYQTVGGFTALFPHRFYEYMNHYTDDTLSEGWTFIFYGRHDNTRLMDLLNVKYEISHEDSGIYFRESYLPRAFIVPNCRIVRTEKVLDHLNRSDFDPAKTVLFEDKDLGSKSFKGCEDDPRDGGHVKIISYRPDEIVLETYSDSPGFVFLSEIFYPGWKAYVDGERTRILKGNFLFRVIEHPDGKHVVRFVFSPLSIKVGTGISLITLFLLLGFIFYGFRQRSSLANFPNKN